MLTDLKRIIKTGLNEFFRNITLSISTILIMTMVVSLVTIFYFINSVSELIIADIENKVDISVYFKEEATASDISNVQIEISNISEVSSIVYITKNEVLANFIIQHKNDIELIESLTELGYNPFLDTLNIKTWDKSQYSPLTNLIETANFSDIIDNVDYHKRKESIDKIFSITAGINNIILLLSIVFGFIAVLISFNTVRIAIYNSKEEISIMKLVGASNKFVRGPFIVQGILIGFIAALITFILTFLITYFFNSSVNGINMFSIFLNSFFFIILFQLVVGIGLGVLSSYIAIAKYLKV